MSSYSAAYPWPTQWARLAHGLSLPPATPVAVALSGGADSVFLLHLVQRAVPRPKVLAVHIDHGLRGTESIEDAAFCARLCARAGVPFARRHLDVEDGPDLEARLRKARYTALVDEAGRAGIDVLLTGHHEDDALETLLMRMMRGSALGGLSGPARETLFGRQDGRKVRVLRPLLHMRREEVRALLRADGLEWREDSSNDNPRFTRNRVRGNILPAIAESCGDEGLSNLRRFAGAVEGLESELAQRTAHIAWQEPTPRGSDAAALGFGGDRGGTLPRRALTELAPPLQRRALVRLLVEGTGIAPSRDVLDRLQGALAGGKDARTTLPGSWTLAFHGERVQLAPPVGAPPQPVTTSSGSPSEIGGVATLAPTATTTHARPQGRSGAAAPLRGAGLTLGVPGTVQLPDGRSLSALLLDLTPGTPFPRGPNEVHLDASDLPRTLHVRNVQPGDRFHPLGAPGKRPVTRFLADAGVPAGERSIVPLVLHGDDVIWVAGHRPAESRRVHPRSTRRLVLRLEETPESFER